MLYIVVALKAEAQAFVDKYKLKKSHLKEFTLYKNSKYTLIISGMGVSASRAATQTLINAYDITDEDIYINVGICGAIKSFEIGTLLEIGSLFYHEIFYEFHTDKESITCLDDAMYDEQEYAIADMESYGFYDAVVHNPAIQRFYIFKVVSDHFEPHLVTKEKSKMLLFNKIDAINKLIEKEK